jgi:transposase-like protein
MDIRKILDIISEAQKPLQEFMDTGGGDDGDDEMAQRIIDMYFEDGLRETEIARIEGIPEELVHRIIDKHERGLDEAEKPLAKGMKVMSLAQFLQQSGIEAPEGKEETVNELSPQTKKSYSAAAKLDKKYNDNNIDKAKRMSQEQPHKKAEWEDEIEFLKSVNAKRDRGLKRAGVTEGHADQQRKVFKKNGKPVGEVGIDRESSPGVGQWYMKCYAYDIDYSGYDSYEEAVAELKHCLKQVMAEGLSKQAKAKKEAEAVMAAIKRLEAELKNPNKHVDKADIQKRLDTEKRRLELYRDVLDEQGVAEGAPELLKKEMPLVRHIDKILAGHGYKKGTPEYDEHFKQAISYLRKFGNIDLINKQDVAEGEVSIKEYGGYETKRIIQYSKDNPPNMDYLYQQFVQRMLNPENTVDPDDWIDQVNKFYNLNFKWRDYQERGKKDHTNNWQRIIQRYVVQRP